MIQDIMDFLSQADPEVGASIQKEFDREQHNIELIASENIVSKAVLLAMGTCLTNKYAEGYPGKRYYGGCYAVDVTEELARQRACQLFDCAHANVQPHSGANANLAAFFALLQPGDSSFPVIQPQNRGIRYRKLIPLPVRRYNGNQRPIGFSDSQNSVRVCFQRHGN